MLVPTSGRQTLASAPDCHRPRGGRRDSGPQPEPSADPLALDPAAMRADAHLAVDALVDYLTTRNEGPVLRQASPAAARKRLSGPAPAGPTPFVEVLDEALSSVLPLSAACDHPRFMAFIPGCPTWPSVLADFIAAAVNPCLADWMESAGPTQVELDVIRWFANWIGYPTAAGGVLVSGGSHANLTALACARDTHQHGRDPAAVVYACATSHSSVSRALQVLGFAPHQLRILPPDGDWCLAPDTLAAAVDADRRAGLRPAIAVATAGATSTGTVDPLAEIAAVCADRGLWLHADAAYGAFAALTDRGRPLLSGLELADSVTLDPHKWLYQPYACGCVLVRDGAQLERCFKVLPDYLQDTETDRAINLADRGIELTRPFRALKVWMSIRCLGTDAFAAAIDRCLDLARLAQRRIEQSHELEVLSPANLSIVCFRRHPAGVDDERVLERLNAELVSALAESGEGFISSTRLAGRYALRLCVLNHTTTAADVERVLGFLESHSLLAVAPLNAAARAAA